MANSGNEHVILLDGQFQPSRRDTPLLRGSRVATLNDVYQIENPYVGQQVYVEDEEKSYVVRSLKSKDVGGLMIENAAVDRISDLFDELNIENRVYYESEEEIIHLF